MDDDFDILSLLAEEKSKEQLIDDAINFIATSGYQSKNNPKLIYQVIANEFKQWLIDKGFMSDFLDVDIKDSEIEININQAAFSFIYFGSDF